MEPESTPCLFQNFDGSMRSVQLPDTFLIVQETTAYEYNTITGGFDDKGTFSLSRYEGEAVGVSESELNCT